MLDVFEKNLLIFFLLVISFIFFIFLYKIFGKKDLIEVPIKDMRNRLLIFLLIVYIMIFLLFTHLFAFSYYDYFSRFIDFDEALLPFLIYWVLFTIIFGEFLLYKNADSNKIPYLSFPFKLALSSTLILISSYILVNYVLFKLGGDVAGIEIFVMLVLVPPIIFIYGLLRSFILYISIKNENLFLLSIPKKLNIFLFNNFKIFMITFLFLLVIILGLIIFDVQTDGKYLKLSDKDNMVKLTSEAIEKNDSSFCRYYSDGSPENLCYKKFSEFKSLTSEAIEKNDNTLCNFMFSGYDILEKVSKKKCIEEFSKQTIN